MATPTSADLVLEQRCVLPDGDHIEIHLARSAERLAYRLAYLRGGASLLSYESGARREHLRIVRGRVVPYAFRSVEQLRYDFERELEAL